MKNKMLIALDMDGTLLTPQQKILPYTREILMLLQKQGHALVLVSGRDIQSLVRFGYMLEIDQYKQSGYICLNGLETYNSKEESLQKEKRLNMEEAIHLQNLAKKYQLDAIYFFKDQLYLVEEGYTGILDGHFHHYNKEIVQSVEDIPLHYFNNLRKVAFVKEKKELELILKDLQNDAKDHFDLCRVEEDWIEVNPYAINKGTALKKYAQMNNISLQNVIAFGNGENDISMLKEAGIGVAMGNAFESVKCIADEVCESCEDDGIGKFLKRCMEEF